MTTEGSLGEAAATARPAARDTRSGEALRRHGGPRFATFPHNEEEDCE